MRQQSILDAHLLMHCGWQWPLTDKVRDLLFEAIAIDKPFCFGQQVYVWTTFLVHCGRCLWISITSGNTSYNPSIDRYLSFPTIFFQSCPSINTVLIIIFCRLSIDGHCRPMQVGRQPIGITDDSESVQCNMLYCQCSGHCLLPRVCIRHCLLFRVWMLESTWTSSTTTTALTGGKTATTYPGRTESKSQIVVQPPANKTLKVHPSMGTIPPAIPMGGVGKGKGVKSNRCE